MSAPDNGGAAFPCEPVKAGVDEQTGLGIYREQGMTLRDYFIAHTPENPQPWFAAKLPQQPIPNANGGMLRFIGNPSNFSDADRESYEKHKNYLNEYRDAEAMWELECEKQRYIQWPAAWADAMLEARK